MSYIIRELYENRELQQNALRASWDIQGCLIKLSNRSETDIPLAAYLLHKVSQFNNPLGITTKEISDGALDVANDIRFFAMERFNEETWGRLLQLTTKYTPEVFALTALLPINEFEMRGTMATPDSIIRLAHKILNVSENEDVADICCGYGTYLTSAAFEENKANYYGYEINVENSVIATIRADLVDANIKIDLCDAFALAEGDLKFDKIFANYPFGLKLRSLSGGVKYLEQLSAKYPGISKATSSDWVFNALLCDLLTENGKAVGIMTNGSTWNSIDTPMRKYFAENEMIECVISMPNRMFSSTNIPTTLIVLSHGNETIRMIDATKLCQQGRRQNEFSAADINTIVEAMSVDTDYSKSVSLEELRANEYNLSLSRYTREELAFANGVPFENIIKSISRGAPCTASQLDEMVSDSVTNMQYLMLANIQNGMIDDKLPYLSKIEPKFEKYCLKNNTLILSKNGYPYKVAVATVKEGQKILANGNLYIIELDEEKANPYYIKAFFDSEQGHAVLKSITVGATIPNIGVDKLKKVEIPLPSMEEQERIAQKYQATLDEIAMIKLRLEKAINKLHHIFDEECD